MANSVPKSNPPDLPQKSNPKKNDMKNFQELLHTETYWTAKIQAELFAAVEDYLKENKLTRKAFAAQLGVSKGYVTQVLNGDFNHKISKLVELSLAIGKAPVFELENLEETVEKEKSGMQRTKSRYVPVPAYSVRLSGAYVITGTRRDNYLHSAKPPVYTENSKVSTLKIA